MEMKGADNRRRSMAGSYRWQEELLAFCILLGFGFFINASVQIRGLQLDDLYMWSCFADNSFMEYVFPVGTTRFRALYYFVSYLEYFFVGPHINWFVPINITLNAVIAYTLYRFAGRLSGSRLVGYICSLLYLVSRMSYYQIGQVYGVMESLALWAAIGTLYGLYRYLNDEEGGENGFWLACILYFANCFIHERYMALLPLFFLALLLHREKKPAEWLVPPALFLLVQLIRMLTIGTVLPAGSGGTNVADTFTISQTLAFAFQQVMHLFGVNLGDAWLCPPTWDKTAPWVKLVVLAQDLAVLAIVVLFIRKVITERKNRAEYLRNAALFVVFIGLCIGCSSVTVRVELRWVYVSMTAALLLLSYLCGTVSRRDGDDAARERTAAAGRGGVYEFERASGRGSGAAYGSSGRENRAAYVRSFGRGKEGAYEYERPAVRGSEMAYERSSRRGNGAVYGRSSGRGNGTTFDKGAVGAAGKGPAYRKAPVYGRIAAFGGGGFAASLLLISLYGLLSFISEIYYRGFYDELYFWNTQQEYNSLADETWGKYGEDIFGKKIYILENSYDVSRFYADTFFRTFDKERKAEGTEVIFVDSIRDFGQVTNNMLILREDPETCSYQNITNLVRQLKCESIYGYYSDGWMDENALVRVMAGSTGRIDLELLYPGTLTEGDVMTIWMDDRLVREVKIDQNILYISLETKPYRTVELKFANNFYLEDAQEQRGEDRLSLIVNFTTD